MAREPKEAKPWERQDGETPKQFEAFVIYRDMAEERSLSAVARRLNKSKQLLGRWSVANKWVERCAAWDNEQDRLARQDQIKAIKNMRKRHATMANKALDKLEKYLEEMETVEFNPNNVARFAEVFSKLERISLGDVGDVVEERQGESIDPVQIYIPDNNRGRDKETFDDLEV